MEAACELSAIRLREKAQIHNFKSTQAAALLVTPVYLPGHRTFRAGELHLREPLLVAVAGLERYAQS